jgi:hypothetical protein
MRQPVCSILSSETAVFVMLLHSEIVLAQEQQHLMFGST